MPETTDDATSTVKVISRYGMLTKVKTTKNENSFVILSLATKRSWKNRETGERQSQTTWHRCIVWGKLGEYAATLAQGAHVQIEGEIQSREYTLKGTGKNAADIKKSITEVRVSSILKLDRRTGSDNPGPEAGTRREVAA